jgi:hypothetical protein
MDTTMKLRVCMLIFGILSILDGFGSILVYPKQPLWPDHTVRILRMAQGMIEIILGVIIGVLILAWAPPDPPFQKVSLERQRTNRPPGGRAIEPAYSEFMSPVSYSKEK